MSWESELKKSGKNKAFFYVTLDPERALGLEDILPNYTIICPYRSQLASTLKHICVLEECFGQTEIEEAVKKGTYGILELVHDRKIIGKNAYVMLLKNSGLIEDFCKKQGWRLLAPKAEIAEKFENKISQYKLLKNVVPYPKSIVETLGKISRGLIPFCDFRSPPCVERKLLTPTALLHSKRGFVLQFNRGHSGNSTFFIRSKKDIEGLYKKYPKREAKISEYIRGKAYTLNCVALQNGEVITGSLSEQITGLKEATNNPNTTCGNDFAAAGKLGNWEIAEIKKIAQKVGKALHKNGYQGLFGIDAIIEKGTKKVYFIELNTHQPASISFEAKLHRRIGKMPLLAYFIMDGVCGKSPPCLPVRQAYEGGAMGGRPPIILPIAAKQIIYRNKTSQVLNLQDIEKKYNGKGLLARVKFIKANEEIYRVQYQSSNDK